MQYVAGIDPSITNTGVVILDANGKFVSAYNSSSVAKNKFTTDIELYIARATGVTSFLATFSGNGNKLLLAAYEDYSYGSTHRAMSLGEFGGILKAKLLENIKLKYVLKAPSSVKKFATGNGTAGKEKMREQALLECPELEVRLGKELTNDICDAYFLAKMAWYTALPQQISEKETNRDLVRFRIEHILAAAKDKGEK